MVIGLLLAVTAVNADMSALVACRTPGQDDTASQTRTHGGANLGITDTPTLFVDGRLLVGAQPLEAFATIIDEQRAAVGPTRSAAGC
jgi:protein-disulfide isomerase